MFKSDHRIALRLIVGVIYATLVACGGGGSGGSSASAGSAAPNTPEITVAPAAGAISFGNQSVFSQGQAQTITVTNSGNVAIDVTDVSIDMPQFVITSGPNFPTTINAGSSVSIEAAFAPDSERSFVGQATIIAAGLAEQHIALNGTGVTPMSVSPSSITFADQPVNTTSSPQAFTITNSGNAAVQLTTVSVAPPFEVVNSPAPGTIAGGASLDVQVTYTPVSPGSHDVSLTVSYQALNDQLIDLAGTSSAVGSGTFTITTDELPTATVNSAYFADVYTEDATLPISWSLAPGQNLPAGLDIDPTSGRVSGVPITTGGFAFAVDAEDSSSPPQSASALIGLSIGSQTGANCDGITTGLVPLATLGAGFYQGEQGGYYPNGSNVRPAAHSAGGNTMTAAIEPLDSNGNPDASGSYVLLSIGMSNTTQEFSRFKTRADVDPELNPRLVIVDGAQGAQPASVIANPSAAYWSNIDTRLSSEGVTGEQVQIAWIKQANGAPSGDLQQYAGALRDDLADIARILKSRYPNIRIAYVSNRIYAGYADTILNPEPYAYQTGFADKWVIQQQIEGVGNLNYDPALGTVVAPWLDWGPDLWADGLQARAGDRLVWTCQELSDDGTHPSSAGRLKVADMLSDFFKTDPLARQWFLANP